MSRKCTSFDVAEKAGVSQSTVSRALRNDIGVSAETRERIWKVATALDYRPDHRAVSLRSRATGRIAVVILCESDARGAPVNSLYMDLLAHVAAAAATRGQTILVSFQHNQTDFFSSYCLDHIADGIIVIGTANNAAGWNYLAKARSRGENIVCWGSPDDVLPTLRCDNEAGAAIAVSHLVATGRRRIAFFGPGWRNHHAYRERRAGYIRIVGEYELPVLEPRESPSGAREVQGYNATLDLINNGISFDAIFAASDGLAVGALLALNGSGRIVPEDVAVIGFDGITAAQHTAPPLTTIQQNVAVAGSYLVESILLMIEGEDYRLPVVPSTLMQRGSC